MAEKAIIFVHGLGGSDETWGRFDDLLASDPSVDWESFHFTYPSGKFGLRLLPTQSHYQPIEVLAQALKNQIDNRFEQYEEIALVGHSLGGLVIRQYLMNEKIASRPTKVNKIILYATPSTGASLSEIGKLFSFWGENGHTRQLCKKSDFLNLLNRNWASSGIEADLEITIIVGGNDRIVSRESVEASFRTQEREPLMILEAGHLDIAKPTSVDDDRYIFLKNALKKKLRLTQLKALGGLPIGEWGRYAHNNTLPFHLDSARSAQIIEIQKHFGQRRKILRVTGLSGLGKTRLVYEAALKIEKSLAHQIVYIDAAPESINIPGWIRDAIRKGAEGTIIVDNCSVDLHFRLQCEVEREDSCICLVSIDYSPERIQGVPMIRLERFADDDISAMLAPIYREQIDDVEMRKIITFAQGFPQMAVLLANARLNDDPDLGILTDDLIATKLLWGNALPSSEHERILQACALFETFGVDENVSDQFKFIADKVVCLDEGLVYRCLQEFTERGLIDRRGRFAQLVPKPLAVRLAAKWWKQSQRARQLKLIEDLPEVMEGSFCAQIARMDTLPEVKELTAQLCGAQGPFGRAEVLFSRKGSMLFRALVEVNPGATAGMIRRIIEASTGDELAVIIGDTRRNLVWGLEKLSVRAETFEPAAYCLLRLAMAENETWSNNATGQFRQLFRIQLSGTQAPPNKRFAFLNSILATNEKPVTLMVIEALSAGLELNGGFRTIGAEYQGINSKIEEWEPANWGEIADYLAKCLNMMREIISLPSCDLRAIKNTVGPKIRELVQFDQGPLLDKVITDVASRDGPFWPQALDSINSALEYDKEQLKPEAITNLETWLRLLGGQDASLEDKLKILVIEPPFEHRDREGEFIDVAAENAITFARQISQDHAAIELAISMLTQQHAHRQTFIFGRALALAVDDPQGLIREIWEETKKSADPSMRLFNGAMAGLSSKNGADWRNLIDELGKDSSFISRLFPDVLTTGQIKDQDLSLLKTLVEREDIKVQSLGILAYGSVLQHLPPDVVSAFALELLNLKNGTTNAWVALDILFMYCHSDAEKRQSCRDAFRDISLHCPLGIELPRKDLYQWNVICKWLCPDDAGFRTALIEKICKAVEGSELSNSEIDELRSVVKSALQEVNWEDAEILIEPTWKILTNSIANATGLPYLYFLWIFEARRARGSDGGNRVFDLVPSRVLLRWCDDKPDIAPFFVAKTVKVLVEKEGELGLNPILVELLSKFGSTGDLGSEIESNLFTRTWSGSLVPALQREQNALAKLVDHESLNVRRWAADFLARLDERINVEQRRDDERTLGRF
ncbi:alpha/beta fold hydrolase [Massilia sp. Dwa41.01b]|uniref:esterase/lipase family protein n=1 Tax=unclassified Massilia TaxID=2609279 RepID=UPI001603CDAA|nr:MULTISPECIES: alpha/beta fold hydrolase [unclassified Massilia]QNA88252.1 alpha/beta fold hydrolase [Massilia sp. Dwa41.01b]QNA99152.1 alpha/beta fold hydrolase [Massilia sp. Se16.2.3]